MNNFQRVWWEQTKADHSIEFPIWSQLTETGRGRQLLKVIDAAVLEFPKYA